MNELQKALNLYGRHLGWCKKMQPMPMVHGRTYIYPDDDIAWREKQECNCGWEKAAGELLKEGWTG